MTSLRSTSRALAAARISAGLAAVILGFVIWRTTAPMNRLSARSSVVDSSDAAIADGAAMESVDISRLIARDPFSPTREAPAVPYRIGSAPTATVVREQAQPVTLLGTIVRPTGRSFAMCQLGAEPPRVVYPGGRIGNLTLESVTQGSASFVDAAGRRVVLHVPRSGG